jgi:hypothetical protein
VAYSTLCSFKKPISIKNGVHCRNCVWHLSVILLASRRPERPKEIKVPIHSLALKGRHRRVGRCTSSPLNCGACGYPGGSGPRHRGELLYSGLSTQGDHRHALGLSTAILAFQARTLSTSVHHFCLYSDHRLRSRGLRWEESSVL